MVLGLFPPIPNDVWTTEPVPMLGPDDLADVEGDALAICRMANTDPDQPTSMSSLCSGLTGFPPVYDPALRGRGVCRMVDDRRRVFVAPRLPPAIEKHTIAHECGEWFYGELGYEGEDREERCDALAAALCAMRPCFLRAVRQIGCRVHALAEAFGVTQSVSLLRIGEVTGRPVALLRWPEPIFRGAPFAWPKHSTLRRALEEGRDRVHPCRITDEPNRIGLLARWDWNLGDG